jgi:hypothetical protein
MPFGHWTKMKNAGENFVTESLNSWQSKFSVNHPSACSAWDLKGNMFFERLATNLNQRISGGTLMSAALLTSVLLWGVIVGLALSI